MAPPLTNHLPLFYLQPFLSSHSSGTAWLTVTPHRPITSSSTHLRHGSPVIILFTLIYRVLIFPHFADTLFTSGTLPNRSMQGSRGAVFSIQYLSASNLGQPHTFSSILCMHPPAAPGAGLEQVHTSTDISHYLGGIRGIQHYISLKHRGVGDFPIKLRDG